MRDVPQHRDRALCGRRPSSQSSFLPSDASADASADATRRCLRLPRLPQWGSRPGVRLHEVGGRAKCLLQIKVCLGSVRQFTHSVLGFPISIGLSQRQPLGFSYCFAPALGRALPHAFVGPLGHPHRRPLGRPFDHSHYCTRTAAIPATSATARCLRLPRVPERSLRPTKFVCQACAVQDLHASRVKEALPIGSATLQRLALRVAFAPDWPHSSHFRAYLIV